MLLGITLSALGNGLVLPFAFVYLHSIRHISTSMAGLIFSYGAVISLLVAPMVGTLIDRWTEADFDGFISCFRNRVLIILFN